jgi:membrane-associated phospholipid phosphatase
MTTRLPPEDDRRRRGYRVANAVSYVLNPFVFPPVGFGLVQAHFGAGAPEIAWTVAVSAVFFCLVPVLYLLGMVRRGRAESLEIRDRAGRLRPFLVGVGSYLVGIALLGATVRTALPLIVAIAAIFPANTLLVALINTRWKISVHMTSLAGFVSVLLFVALTVWRGLPPEAEAALTAASVAPLLLLLPLLMWARVRVEAHTPGQVLAGAAFGLLVPLAELYVLVYLVLGLAG